MNSNTTIASLLLAMTACFVAVSATAEQLYEDFPASINPAQKYVFYSHGFIVEGDDPRPIHPEYGQYEFPAIKQRLFDIGGFNLIAHHRPEATDIETYASKLVNWVNRLLDAGVSSGDITLIGFSRGSLLTAIASGRLQSAGINTVLMASCFDGEVNASSPPSLGGRLLSIYEVSDTAGSCYALEARGSLVSFDEIEIATGKKHGAFYTPLPEWIEPIDHWMHAGD